MVGTKVGTFNEVTGVRASRKIKGSSVFLAFKLFREFDSPLCHHRHQKGVKSREGSLREWFNTRAIARILFVTSSMGSLRHPGVELADFRLGSRADRDAPKVEERTQVLFGDLRVTHKELVAGFVIVGGFGTQ